MSNEKQNLSYAGYDYLCKNKKCKNYWTKITLLEMCPIVRIEDAIAAYTAYVSAPESKQDEHYGTCVEIKEALEAFAAEGRLYAVAPINISSDVDVVGYRTQFFCPDCSIVWDKDVLALDPNEIQSELNDFRCEKCGKKPIGNVQAEQVGIFCPSCKEQLNRVYWLSGQKNWHEPEEQS